MQKVLKQDLHKFVIQELLYYFFDWRWIKINPKRLRIKMYSFLKAFLVLMKLLSLSQFYAPKYWKRIVYIVK